MLTLLRRDELTKTVWDGAQASTNPFIEKRVPILMFLMLRIYSLTRVVWVLTLLRRDELTKTVWNGAQASTNPYAFIVANSFVLRVLTFLRRHELTRVVWVLTLLRRDELTKTVWDGAKASTNPYVNN
ncbi:hypothetical protein BFR39_00685 [Brochothrix thermosphacta]|uniref:Uncharacterized protein n=1 Tax=Brochothrix thermosphacta TaxID=2756 RepID=A0A1D2LX01_BROTH|nr:hypothetical protein CNY62_08250 [Brochothrix thermosphacta]ATH85709.1 hypothetical protein CPF12_07845 [Brochothrix thermosphacta]ODJ68371.1 hypothetical protein BFR36_00850 [Brochothrix thermosphacta]ODJ74493.1 hypothetical protein BFR39_00685 [Brochothrix thermosphacta]